MTTREEADSQLFDDFILTDDGFCKFFAECLIGFPEFVDCRDVIGRELIFEVVWRIHE